MSADGPYEGTGTLDMERPSGTAEFYVTADAVQRYVAACGGSWPGTDETVPTTLASVYCYAAVAAMPVKAGVVLTGQSYEFHRRIALGDRATTDFWVTDEFERKGRNYMVIQTRTTNQRGELVCVGRITRMLPAQRVEVE